MRKTLLLSMLAGLASGWLALPAAAQPTPRTCPEAKKRGKSIEQTGIELRIATQLYMSSILAQVPDSGPVLLAIAKFAEKPGRLTVNAKSKAAGGVPIAELGTSKEQSTTVVSRFDVKAVAE